MSAFAGSLPPWLQTTGLWAGFVSVSIGVFSIPWHVYRQAITKRRGRMGIEPYDLVVLGLGGMIIFGIIALSGVIWQQLAGTTVAPVKSEVTIASPTDLTRFPKGTAYDVRIEIPVLDNILATIRDNMEPMVQEGYGLQSNWWNGLADKKNNPDYVAKVQNFRDREKVNFEKLEAIRKKYPQYQDIDSALNQTYYDHLLKSTEEFMIAINTLATRTDFHGAQSWDYEHLMKPFNDDFKSALASYHDWIARTKNAVILRRRQLEN